jgi:hypothetical protein
MNDQFIKKNQTKKENNSKVDDNGQTSIATFFLPFDYIDANISFLN